MSVGGKFVEIDPFQIFEAPDETAYPKTWTEAVELLPDVWEKGKNIL